MDQVTSIDWVIAIGAVATAVFTGILAFIGWRQKVGGIVAEWEFSYGTDSINLTITIRNLLRHSIDAWKIEASGMPIVDVLKSSRDEKHESWPSHASGFDGRNIEPGSAKRAHCRVVVDWEELSETLSKRWFFKSALTLSMRVMVNSKTSPKWHKRLTTKIRIPAEAIEKNVAIAAQAKGDID